jgi:hypothetical protein
MKPADYLLGRKTYEIWEGYWPEHADREFCNTKWSNYCQLQASWKSLKIIILWCQIFKKKKLNCS